MPSITFTSAAALVANIHIGSGLGDVAIEDLGDGTIAVLIGDDEVGARLIGDADVIHSAIIAADTRLARLGRGDQ